MFRQQPYMSKHSTTITTLIIVNSLALKVTIKKTKTNNINRSCIHVKYADLVLFPIITAFLLSDLYVVINVLEKKTLIINMMIRRKVKDYYISYSISQKMIIVQ